MIEPYREMTVRERAMESSPKLIVTERDGRFYCARRGATGSEIEGSGASPVEAVGSWAIHSATVAVVCEPPELLETFEVAVEARPDLGPAPRRG